MKRSLVASLAMALLTPGFIASPAIASVNWETCSQIGFWYANWPGSGNPNLIAEDRTVFGSDTSDEDCRALVGHSDAKMHESDANSRDTFVFRITGQVLPSDAIFTVDAYLNDALWVLGTAANTNPSEKLFKVTLGSEQHQRFKDMTHLGENEIKVISTCADYPIADKTLVAKVLILEDSFRAGTNSVVINTGATYTNSSHVKLNLSFASKTLGQIRIRNFGDTGEVFDYRKNTVDWVLGNSRTPPPIKNKKGKLVKQPPRTSVFVSYRYFDPSSGQLLPTWSSEYQYEVLFDTTKPKLNYVLAYEQNLKSKNSKAQILHFDEVSGDDDISLKSSKLQFRYKVGKKMVTKNLAYFAGARTASVFPRVNDIEVRISDEAGNWSDWVKVPAINAKTTCKTIKAYYPNGIAKSRAKINKKKPPIFSNKVYLELKGKDGDKDGIACES
jgi:hypothetical protein